MREVLEKMGCRLVFWGVLMKPGFPLLFGRFEAGPLVFGLPGNPVSAMVTFEQFVRPALLRMQGRRRIFRPTIQARSAERLTKPAGRLHFVRVSLERDAEGFVAHTAGNQSSGVLRSMIQADGLLVFPADATEIAEGAVADVQLLDPEVLSEEASRI
jgi:molybdopterin molybdotransferase